MTTRILRNCKHEHGVDVDYDDPDFSRCLLWQQSSFSARPFIVDPKKGMIDARDTLYIYEKGDIPRGLKSVPKCSSTRCVNPFHCELVTEYEERRRKYELAGGDIARQISLNVTNIDPEIIHQRVMNNIMLGFFIVEKDHTKKASVDDLKVRVEKYSRKLRCDGVQKVKNRLQRSRKSIQAFKIYCLTSLDLNLKLC